MKKLSILGSTGSIGRSTLDVVRKHPDKFKVVALAAGRNTELLSKQIEEFKPKAVSILSEDDRKGLMNSLPSGVECLCGDEGASFIAAFEEADLLVSAFSGSAGLKPTLSAIRAKKDVAIANKEVLVMAGKVFMDEAIRAGVSILPVDSEHSAIFQSIEGNRHKDIQRLILTASGGPFFSASIERLRDVMPHEALAHPNWNMGKKVTIDSATLMNKGLEVIEASWLFDMPYEKIAVYIHPQSAVHSMVEYIDGSVIAQLGTADMKVPIAYALSYPERIDSGALPLDLIKLKSLEFFEPDRNMFPCLELAYDALKEGGTMPAIINAADEIAVEAFLKKEIAFLDIAIIIDKVMRRHKVCSMPEIEEILEADRWARDQALEMIRGERW